MSEVKDTRLSDKHLIREDTLRARLACGNRILDREIRRGETAMLRGALVAVFGAIGAPLAAVPGEVWSIPAVLLFAAGAACGAYAATSRHRSVWAVTVEAVVSWATVPELVRDVRDALGSELVSLGEQVRTRRQSNNERITWTQRGLGYLVAGALLSGLAVVG